MTALDDLWELASLTDGVVVVAASRPWRAQAKGDAAALCSARLPDPKHKGLTWYGCEQHPGFKAAGVRLAGRNQGLGSVLGQAAAEGYRYVVIEGLEEAPPCAVIVRDLVEGRQWPAWWCGPGVYEGYLAMCRRDGICPECGGSGKSDTDGTLGYTAKCPACKEEKT